MPFGRCPVCGASYHIHINLGLPFDVWYYPCWNWPWVWFGEKVPGECLRCWVPLQVGHRVTVRVVPAELAGTVNPGTTGVVTAVEPGEQPVFVVELQGAGVASGRFRRSELWYTVDQPPVPEAPDAEPGAAADGGGV